MRRSSAAILRSLGAADKLTICAARRGDKMASFMHRASRMGMAAALVVAILPGEARLQASAAAQAPVEDYGLPITVADALALISKGMAQARKEGLRQSFAVVEPSGELVAFARMDGVSYGSIRAAEAKARTSARHRVATAVREQQLMGRRLSILSNDEVFAIGGGAPIVRGGRTIGSVGVSGGTADQDAHAAAALGAAP